MSLKKKKTKNRRNANQIPKLWHRKALLFSLPPVKIRPRKTNLHFWLRSLSTITVFWFQACPKLVEALCCSSYPFFLLCVLRGLCLIPMNCAKEAACVDPIYVANGRHWEHKPKGIIWLQCFSQILLF